MTAIDVKPGEGNPDHDHHLDIDIMIATMVVVAEIEAIAPISVVIAIIRGQEAAKDLRPEKSKAKELSNISKHTKEIEMIIDSRTRQIIKDSRPRKVPNNWNCRIETRSQISKWPCKKSDQKILKLALSRR
jgi:hypothetical protein